MHITQLKKNLVIRSVIVVVLVAVLSQGYLFLSRQQKEMVSQRDWLNNDINALKNKLSNLNQQTLKFAEAVDVWEKLSDEQKALQGIRLSRAKEVFDALKSKYKINQLNAEFQKPKVIENAPLKAENMEVYVSQVNLDVLAMTDESLLKLVQALGKEVPGYIIITKFSMLRGSQEVDKDLLRSISEGKFPGIVQGKISFFWYDIKYVVKEKE